jgi:general stress protein 26
MAIMRSADFAKTPDVVRLLAGARAVIAEVPYCWVVTPAAEAGGANARVVKAFPNADGEAWWIRWFLTRSAARKTAEIRKAGRVTLAFQHASGEAYVTLRGPVALIEERSAVESRLQRVDDPGSALAGQLIAVRLEADHIEVHIRGVTAEPWGHGRTLLAREPNRTWRLLPPPS